MNLQKTLESSEYPLDELKQKGFVIIQRVLNDSEISDLTKALSKLNLENGVRKRRDSVYGIRNLLNLSPQIKEFARSDKIRGIVENFTRKDPKPVRAIYFDKTSEANWKVPWHQDLTISVKEKKETKGFSAWTMKSGIQHVQPTVEVLENIVTLRFHLDDADESDGALKVLEGTHRKGRLNAEEIKVAKQKANSFLCEASKGDLLVMRPLLVHSSSAGSNPKNRRVIHLDYSAENLPNGLEWYGS